MAMRADERGYNRLAHEINVRASCGNAAGLCVIADLLDLAIGKNESDMIARAAPVPSMRRMLVRTVRGVLMCCTVAAAVR